MFFLNSMQTKISDKKVKMQNCTLKIFNGLHRGAEVPLTEGHYSLGKSESCDIILNDHGINENHLALSVEKGRLKLIIQQDDITVDGKKISKGSIYLEPNKILTVGSVHLGVWFDNQKWQPESLPRIDKNENTTQKSRKTIGRRLQIPLLKGNIWVLIGVGLVIVIGLLIVLLGGQKTKTINVVDDVRYIFLSMNLPEPQITYTGRESLHIKGYTKSFEQKTQLQQKIDVYPYKFIYTIFVSDHMFESSRQVISNLGLPITVSYQPFGIITLDGFVDKREEVGSALLRLKQDVPGLQKINNHIWVIEELIPNLDRILIGYNLKDQVKFKPYMGFLLASGVLGKDDLETWKRVKLDISKKYGPHLVIKDDFQILRVEKPLPGKIKLPITSVTIGEIPYFTLKGGNKYFEGSSLKNGMIVKNISANRITVDVDGRLYYCDF